MFFSFTSGMRDAQALVACSANLETTVMGVLPDKPSTGVIHLFKKNIVASITQFWDADGRVYEVTPFGGGRPFQIRSKHMADERPAGSSVNVGFALRHLGVSVGVIAPVGDGTGAINMDRSLRARGIECCLFRNGRGTPRTLTVCDPLGRGSTLFCVKHAYVLDEYILENLAEARPRFVILTGIKQADLPLARGLIACYPGVRKALMPGIDLLDDPGLAELAAQVDIVQVNGCEAAQILGVSSFTPENTPQLAGKIGAKNTIVTMGEHGACLADAAGGIVHQPAYRTNVADTSGAGDAHLAYFCYFSAQRSLCEALRVGAYAAGRKVAHLGPSSGLPTLAECERELANG